MKIMPVLLCGGSGSRLWRLSRKSFSTRFKNIIGNQSLLQATVQRFAGPDSADPVFLTGNDFRFIVAEQVDVIGIRPAGILIEPSARYTAPAAIAAALFIARTDPEALVLLAPSDHGVNDPLAFHDAVARGAVAAREGQIVTFGIAATRPKTGYVWLAGGAQTHEGVHSLDRFIEKPDFERVNALLAEPKNIWNSGMFLSKAQTLIDAFATHAPAILSSVQKTMATASEDLNFTRIEPKAWDIAPEDSIDYEIMEKVDKVSVVRFEGKWSVLGIWESVWPGTTRDDKGNVPTEGATAHNCKNAMLRSESPESELVEIGLQKIVAVAMRDAVLVADMYDSQNVKTAVGTLREKGAKQAETFPVDHRPWGRLETLVLADRFLVKRIHVHPGALLSLQSHHHRSDPWIVTAGAAKVTVDDDVRLVTENRSIYVPLGAIHRMETPVKLPMVAHRGAYRCLTRRGRHNPRRRQIRPRVGREGLTRRSPFNFSRSACSRSPNQIFSCCSTPRICAAGR